ncbi:hypothetical protein LTS13_007976 [Exophiala xenobiotica]|nr:hypothetical protein LTS06_010250 [Exophiala xenobiotica]KAK5261002.1 hypothetical protein LTR40_003068 [Exophiala xenobiotica]KAK5367123.1 hypothetical protein LTS13_007976 [Exophiala xenobiotica]KAK5407008.1 hypothetical protein LTR90_010265 [Exophiala xenobiotica]KAK5506431.1 hypothetical protein LTR83_000984 [Exophiala xenobiotica]
MRTRCSGGDRCSKCVKDNAKCVYGDRKRERNKKDLAESFHLIDELRAENQVLLAALRSLAESDDFDSHRHSDILDLLSRYPAEPSEKRQSSSQSLIMPRSSRKRQATFSPGENVESGDAHGEEDVAWSVGSSAKLGELDHVVDLDAGAGACGFVGGWSYFMDEHNVLAIDEDLVDPYEWPPAETTIILSEAFFHAMQGTFPFVLREPFIQAIFSYQHQKLVPNIDRVQGMGLLAFYLLIIGSISRAWNTLGAATRHATALGLHLIITDITLNDTERERRARTWYSLYSLEILIAEIIGRPKSTSLSDVTIPIQALQRSLTEEQEVSQQNDSYRSTAGSRRMWLDFLTARHELPKIVTGEKVHWMSLAPPSRGVSRLYFSHRLHFCHLSDRIATQLYSGTSNDSWSQVQRKISELQTNLENMSETLPDELKLQSDETGDTDPRPRIELAMYYYSLQMMLHRPCLCDGLIENQSGESQEFNRNSAQTCVYAAISLLATLPDSLTAQGAYQLLRWWTLLHYVSQATVVLMLEMALNCQHLEEDVGKVMHYLRKAMLYISCMTGESLSAYRAWRMFRQLLSAVLRKHEHYGAMGIPEESHRPRGWTEDDEASIRHTLLRYQHNE